MELKMSLEYNGNIFQEISDNKINSHLEVTRTDISLLLWRRQLIIRMIEQGKIDPVQGMDLWEDQTREDVMREEQEAYMNPDSTREDSPLGRLAGVYFRINPDLEIAKRFKESE